MLCRGLGGGGFRGGKRRQEDSEEPEGSERADGSEYSELADTACRVPTTLSLTNSFPLSVFRFPFLNTLGTEC